MLDLEQMRFRRYGQSYHLRIDSAADLKRVPKLTEALWVASGASTESIHADPVFEQYIDIDRNERIMCFEVKEAILWMLQHLSDLSGVDAASTSLKLDAINSDLASGRQIREAAEKILRQLKSSDSSAIELDQVRQVKKEIEGRPISEAGVVLPSAARVDETRQFIDDIVAALGGVGHPGGEQGIDEAHLEQFIKEATAWLEWKAQAAIPKRKTKTDIMPLGPATSKAYAAYRNLESKLDQYFAQCRLVSLDPDVQGFFEHAEADLKAADLSDPTVIVSLLESAPLALPSGSQVLDLEGGGNPHYAGAIRAFREAVVKPILKSDSESLTLENWEQVKAVFSAHKAWEAARPATGVEKLAPEKLQAYVSGSEPDAVRLLIKKSQATAVALGNIRQVEKLILYQAYMLHLVNNFVSFPYLYDPTQRAVFEMGTLIIDGRNLDFSIKVEDRKQHSSIAKTSNIFILYVEVMPGGGRPSYEVAVPVTSGGKGNLCLGKRGVFRDIKGEECDAKVVQILENPISLAETLVAPFQRLGKLLTGKIEEMTSSAEKKLDSAAKLPAAPEPVPPAAAEPKGMMAGGLLVGGSVAVAALSSAVAFITKTLKGVNPLAIVIGFLVAILAFVAPASIIAAMKLRRRDLSAVLEGAGWAINARMRLTMKQGRLFTHHPKRPGKDLFSIT